MLCRAGKRLIEFGCLYPAVSLLLLSFGMLLKASISSPPHASKQTNVSERWVCVCVCARELSGVSEAHCDGSRVDFYLRMFEFLAG